jgi:ATP-dependent helicase HrpA
MADRVVEQLFGKNIRSENDFYAHAEASAPKILPEGQQLLDNVLPVLRAYHETRTMLYRSQEEHPDNSAAAALYSDLRKDLASLVPENFIDLYAPDRLIHVERYIKAVGIRVQRAATDFEKDQAKQKEVGPFADKLNQLVTTLSPHASDQKRNAIEDFFWMLEEFKVSVFAQELKTDFPVSPKRLQEKLKHIERMI